MQVFQDYEIMDLESEKKDLFFKTVMNYNPLFSTKLLKVEGKLEWNLNFESYFWFWTFV